ncbi:Hypothetical predicted protein [Octopus vulgaris]|uniref:Uncharacterized protein n=1 Tax=Octopus vulgaris TaxID=6645 RepID=A0AA36BVY4_OCTVU|nr:Hypothetical predicted protein [Octopus vulgaris]
MDTHALKEETKHPLHKHREAQRKRRRKDSGRGGNSLGGEIKENATKTHRLLYRITVARSHVITGSVITGSVITGSAITGNSSSKSHLYRYLQI